MNDRVPSKSGPEELDAFQADARDTAQGLQELAASLEVKGLLGGAAICKRAASLIYEKVVGE